MFNSGLKKEAFRIHKETLERYDQSYKKMSKSCEILYDLRGKSVEVIEVIKEVINSIANTPKEFDTELGKIGKEIQKFRETEEYAREAYEAAKKAGANIAGGAAVGLGIASMAPTALMGFASVFGTASTGTAISALSGAAAQKAAVAWIGRTFAGFAVKEGAGLAAGQAFLALAGPLGWGISAASTGISLFSLTNNNKKLADSAVNEAKEIAKAREALDETSEKIGALTTKTDVLRKDLENQMVKIRGFMNRDYMSLETNDKAFLGTLVNNILTLSLLLNEIIE